MEQCLQEKNYRHLITEQGFNQTSLFSFVITKEMFRHWARKITVNLHVLCYPRKEVKNSFLAQCSNYLKSLTRTAEMLNVFKI